MAELSSDPVEILIRSDAWGTRQVLGVCRGLTHEQFHKVFPIGLGSLHETLTHMLSAARRWTDRVQGRTPRPMLHAMPQYPHLAGESKDRTPDELLALLNEVEEELLKAARQHRDALGTTVRLEWPGENGSVKVYTFTRGAVFVHVATHGYHHRAQCLNMLRQLGAPVPGVAEGLPEPSAVDWQTETESPAVVR